MRGAWLGKMPRYPSRPGICASWTSSRTTWRSGVTIRSRNVWSINKESEESADSSTRYAPFDRLRASARNDSIKQFFNKLSSGSQQLFLFLLGLFDGAHHVESLL